MDSNMRSFRLPRRGVPAYNSRAGGQVRANRLGVSEDMAMKEPSEPDPEEFCERGQGDEIGVPLYRCPKTQGSTQDDQGADANFQMSKSSGNSPVQDDNTQESKTAILQQPLILTAEPHVPFDPLFVDENTSPDISAPVQDRPVFHRLGSHRAPPTTPPETVNRDQLSMPTLPSLHLTSIPVLIEQYRTERRLSPAIFDKRTMEIKNALIQAKVERGGENNLLSNEYTAELASRLDAEAIERWSVVRQHDDEAYVESDGEDAASDLDLEDFAVHDDQGPTLIACNPGDCDCECHEIHSTKKPTTDVAATDLVNEPTACGTIAHKREIHHNVHEDGTKQYTYEAWLKITRVVNTPNTPNDETAKPELEATNPNQQDGIITNYEVTELTDEGAAEVEEKLEAADVTAHYGGEASGIHHGVGNTTDTTIRNRLYDAEELALENIIRALVNLRAAQGADVSEDLLVSLEETKMHLKALRESGRRD